VLDETLFHFCSSDCVNSWKTCHMTRWLIIPPLLRIVERPNLMADIQFTAWFNGKSKDGDLETSSCSASHAMCLDFVQWRRSQIRWIL